MATTTTKKSKQKSKFPKNKPGRRPLVRVSRHRDTSGLLFRRVAVSITFPDGLTFSVEDYDTTKDKLQGLTTLFTQHPEILAQLKAALLSV